MSYGKVFIYMNHQIRKKKPDGPTIVVRRFPGPDGAVEGDMVVINGPCVVRFDPRGLPMATEHDVKAWIEADLADVIVK